MSNGVLWYLIAEIEYGYVAGGLDDCRPAADLSNRIDGIVFAIQADNRGLHFVDHVFVCHYKGSAVQFRVNEEATASRPFSISC